MSEKKRGTPNILWICTDQQRYDTIHCLNNPAITTPNLDRLCAEGVAFSRAYAQSAVCTPSRASFLTGLYPSTVHVNRNGLPRFPEQPHIKLITKRLADAGYDCGLAGKLHISSPWFGMEERPDDGYRCYWYSHAPVRLNTLAGNDYIDWLRTKNIDFDEFFQPTPCSFFEGYTPHIPIEYHQTTWCVDRAIEFITQERSEPWLMSVNIFDPHPPFDAPAAYKDRYDETALPPPLFRESDFEVQKRLKDYYFQTEAERPGDQEQFNKASYYGMVELVDEQVGRLLATLEATGQRENTVVIFMSDHGEMLGDHGLTLKGCRFYEGLVRVPLIISWPGHFQQGVVADGLVELTDLAPTLAELADVPLEWTHGRSLLPILKGQAPPEKHRDFVRCEYYDTLNMHVPEEPEKHTSCWATMYRDERYKLAVYHGLDYGELYDLETDPHEFCNLWEDPKMQDIKHTLIKRSFDASIIISDPGPALIGRY